MRKSVRENLNTETQDDEPPSKSQRKRDVEALQQLGGRLIELEPADLKRFELPERLHEAILEAQSIKANGAKRRQLQYIGKLMRDADGDSIQQQLEAFQDGSQSRKRYEKKVETWRDRLLDDSNAFTVLVEEYPDIDQEALKALIAEARIEKNQANPSPKAYRKLFKTLKTLMPFLLTVESE
ncbi:MAG: ribosome biogenesis factor YjgA [Pseudomonadota bacterium]